jgi:hypothetical protein
MADTLKHARTAALLVMAAAVCPAQAADLEGLVRNLATAAPSETAALDPSALARLLEKAAAATSGAPAASPSAAPSSSPSPSPTSQPVPPSAAESRPEFRDPMRAPQPPAPAAAAAPRESGSSAEAQPSAQLWSIRRTEGKAAQAWIGENRISVGDTLGGWRVHAIESNALVLQSVANRKEFQRLALNPVEIRRAAGSP